MIKEVETDGFITRNEDISEIRQTCFNCKHYNYSLFLKGYICTDGHVTGGEGLDWRQKYGVCDRWKSKR